MFLDFQCLAKLLALADSITQLTSKGQGLFLHLQVIAVLCRELQSNERRNERSITSAVNYFSFFLKYLVNLTT